MNITSSEIDSDSISLVSDTTFTRLVLSYNQYFTNTYTLTDLNNTEITITKEALDLKTLNNNYFRLEILDEINNKAAIGLHNIEVINELEAKLYDAKDLKSNLDNINFYYGVLEDLTNRQDFSTANEFFFNYINFLEKELHANNFLSIIRS